MSVPTTTKSEPSEIQGESPEYSAAMLADLAGASLSTIRRWTRRGHLKPKRTSNRLVCYSPKEIHATRMLVELFEGGLSLAQIDRMIDVLNKTYPELDRPMLELPLVIDHGRLYLRDGSTLTDPDGQQQFAFNDADADSEDEGFESPSVLSLSAQGDELSVEQARELALELRDGDDAERAIEAWRLVLATGRAEAEDHFALAELLYECDEHAAARERYYMALELDESYLEARLNLGCLLRELGEPRLAAATFRGALDRHDRYADAHYHLASTLDSIAERDEASRHWREFLQLAPHSPWADEARRRLEPVSE